MEKLQMDLRAYKAYTESLEKKVQELEKERDDKFDESYKIFCGFRTFIKFIKPNIEMLRNYIEFLKEREGEEFEEVYTQVEEVFCDYIDLSKLK